jgi:tetratricopeptide (TPR) repeat protein
LDEKDAAQKLEQIQRDGILRDPYWAHAYWARAKSAPSRAARISDLEWTVRFDPDLLSARLQLAWQFARAGDPQCTAQIVEAARRVKTSFLLQQQLALLLFKLGGGVTLLVLVASSLIVIARSITSIRHALTERLSFLPPEARSAGAILTLCTPLILAIALPPTSAMFWILLMGTVATWTLLAKWEKRICLWGLAGLLAAPWGIAIWAKVMEPASPGAYTRLLWEAQSTEDAWTLHQLRRADRSASAENPDYLSTLALAARREKNYAEAKRLLERAIAVSPNEWGYHNNLGNVYLLAGRPDAALEAYGRAKQKAPAEPRIRYNEAQAWMEKLELARAQSALEEAKRLGYHAPLFSESSQGGLVLLEETLSPLVLWKRVLADFHPKKISWKRGAEMTLGVLVPFQSLLLCIPLLLSLFYASQTRYLPRLHTCASCGKTICRKCHYRVQRESLCAECFGIRQRVRTPIQREEALSKRRRQVRLAPWAWGIALAAIVPGAGHLYEGRRGEAMLLLFSWFAYLVLTAGPHTPATAPVVLLCFASISVLGYLRCASRRDARASVNAARRI